MGRVKYYSRFVFMAALFFATGCAAKVSDDDAVRDKRAVLRFVMDVDDVKTRTFSKSGTPMSGACYVHGTISDVKEKGNIEANARLDVGWEKDFDDGEEITVVVPCKDKYFAETVGVVSLLKSEVKSAKEIEFWGNDLRDYNYDGCERLGECRLMGRFVFSPIGAKIISGRK